VHYLKARETRQFMRSGELYVPELLLREPYEAWNAAKKDEVDRATEAVDVILAHHVPKPLPGGAGAAIDGVIAAAGRELTGR